MEMGRVEPPRDRKKEKNIKHTGNISLDEIYNVCLSRL
jgi:large subunit ribosomal protein L12e